MKRVLVGIVFLLLVFIAGRVLFPYPYGTTVRTAARRAGLDPRLVLAVIHTESHFKPGVVSSSGARGLMQVMPETAGDVWPKVFPGTPYDQTALFDPVTSISLGTFYLGTLKAQFGGNLSLALAAYNGGGANVRRWIEEGKRNNTTFMQAIRFPETRHFVMRVWVAYGIYRVLYPHLPDILQRAPRPSSTVLGR